MKKTLLLIALSLTICFAGCGEATEGGSTADGETDVASSSVDSSSDTTQSILKRTASIPESTQI